MNARLLFLLVLVALAAPSYGIGAQEERIAPARARLLEELRASGRVGDDLLDAYRQQDRVDVVITLDVPERGTLPRAARRDKIRAQQARALLDCPAGDFELRHRFEHAPGLAGTLDLRALRRLLRNPAVRGVYLDGGGRGALAQAMGLTGGYTALTAGFSGVGVTVATLDSGVDTDHSDLMPALVDEHCVCPMCCPLGGSLETGPGSAEDGNGHGTLVAGVLLSRANTLSSQGMAPAANLVAVKVLDDLLGSFQDLSDVTSALAWVRDNYTVAPPMTSTVRVVNMSFGTLPRYLGDCDSVGGVSIMADVVADLIDRGVVVVAGAGNDGDTVRLPAPACLSNVLSVGAVWDSAQGTLDLGPPLNCTDPLTMADQITCFSNAPANTDVFAAGGLTTGPTIGGGLGVGPGTSVASPLVAGCAALLLEQDPLRTPADIASLVTASPTLVTDPATMLSFPRLDCGNALGLGPDDDDSDFDGITVGAGDNCPADFNLIQSDVEIDGVGDTCDLCAFVEDPTQTDSDMNGIGDACECIGPFHWPGDIDLTGTVDAGDLFILGFNFGQTGVTPTNGDQNCDDVIDGADYTLWADHDGRSNSESDPR